MTDRYDELNRNVLLVSLLLINLLIERAPWVGYSDELNQALRTNWGDFVAAVGVRRSGVPNEPIVSARSLMNPAEFNFAGMFSKAAE